MNGSRSLTKSIFSSLLELRQGNHRQTRRNFQTTPISHFLRLVRRQKRQEKFGSYELILPDANALFSRNLIKSDAVIPDDIPRPIYNQSSMMLLYKPEIYIHTQEELDGIRKACALVRNILDRVEETICAGMTTLEVDELVHRLCVENKAYPSPLGYQGFPRSCCTSVNNVLCHGIPDNRALQDGDIINVDVTAYLQGFHGDASRTFLIGNVDEKGVKLVNDTKEAMMEGIRVCKDGEPLSSIGNAIETFANERGLSVNGDCCGHGIGKHFHMSPTIHHVKEHGAAFSNLTMKEGMVFTVEPILCQGRPDFVKWPDGWTLVSRDGGRNAQFEHTILVGRHGPEILT